MLLSIKYGETEAKGKFYKIDLGLYGGRRIAKAQVSYSVTWAHLVSRPPLAASGPPIASTPRIFMQDGDE